MNHKTYISIADTIGKESKCKRRKVGAILVKNGNIIAFGYNGTPSGFCNDCEDENGVTKLEVLHAESNAIAKCSKGSQSSKNSDLYVSLSPCINCAKMIIQAGIVNVYYQDVYRDVSGLDLLKKAGINCNQIELY